MWKDEESFMRSKGFTSCSFSVWKITNISGNQAQLVMDVFCFLLRHHVTRNGCGLQWLRKGLPCVDVVNRVHKFNPSLYTVINFWGQVTVWYRMSPFCQTGGLFANRALNLAWPKRCFAMINFDAGSSQEIASWTGAAGRSLWSRPWRICRRRRPANEGFEISHRISSPLLLAGWDQQREAAADTVAAPVCQPPATLLQKVYALRTLRRDVPSVIRLLTILGLELSKPTKLSGIGFSIKFCLFLGTLDFDPRKFGLLLYTWERIFPLPGANFGCFFAGGLTLIWKKKPLEICLLEGFKC